MRCWRSYRRCNLQSSDGTINRNWVSEISGVFLESQSKEVDLISDLANDSS